MSVPIKELIKSIVHRHFSSDKLIDILVTGRPKYLVSEHLLIMLTRCHSDHQQFAAIIDEGNGNTHLLTFSKAEMEI